MWRVRVNERGTKNTSTTPYNLYILPINNIQGVLVPRSCQAFRAKMLEIPETKKQPKSSLPRKGVVLPLACQYLPDSKPVLPSVSGLNLRLLCSFASDFQAFFERNIRATSILKQICCTSYQYEAMQAYIKQCTYSFEGQ